MSRKERTIQAVQTHPVRTGVFAVLAVIIAGASLSFGFGYAMPDLAGAQIITVTAPPPPPPPPPVTPPVTPTPTTPAPPPTTQPTNPGNDSGSDSGDSSSDSDSSSNSDDSSGDTDDGITVIGSGDPDTDTPPCCTTEEPLPPPSTPGDIIVNGDDDDDTDTPPCCTTGSPSTPPVIGENPENPGDTDTDTPPCCTETTPITPVTPVTPPVLPPTNPPPPPPPPEAGCIALTASKSEIYPGEAVTLTWKTQNVRSITIAPSVGTFSGSKAASGSAVVHPTTDTTYVGTVSNGTQSVHCRASVHLKETPPSGPRCLFLTASATEIEKGDAVTLSWKYQDASSITIDHGVGTFTTSTGSVVVHPTGDTTYTASVPGDEDNPDCVTSVRIKSTPPSGSRCIFLTASDTNIEKGDAVTIEWKTENADSVTITNVGTFTGSKAASGSAVVHPTEDTTYKASVPGDENNPNCIKTVDVGSTSHHDHACVYLKASDTDVDEGDTVTLSWKTDNASSITIDHGIGKVTPTSEGSIDVEIEDDITYHASVPGDEDNPNCTVSIDVDSGGGGGHHHHHGGGSSPDVYFNSTSRPAAPLSSVYLSQIPYTGLDLGPVGTVVYWLLLVIWSLAAAYLVLFGGVPFMRRRLAAFGASVSDALNSDSPQGHGGTYDLGAAHAMPSGSVHAAAPDAHDAAHDHYAYAAAPAMPRVEKRPAPAPAPAPRMEMSGEGFKRFATAGSLTIDDIVKGLSRESGMQLAAEPQQEDRSSQSEPTDAYAPANEAPAPAAEERPEPQERASFEAAPSREARTEAAPVHPEVTGFIAAILAGERDAVFGTIRRLNQAGHDAEEFVSHAILALDDAYKARIDGTPVHEDVKQVTDHCATSFLERLVTALTTAVDGSYAMGITGIKLALTRALAVAQG